jgi:carbamoyl-phosphate synthase small subunit
MKATLALENGIWYEGEAAGAVGETGGEVVFNTSMTGYQEVLTDPSYAGQIVTMTCPEIGNYGVSSDDHESRGPKVAGFIIRDESPIASNWRAASSRQARSIHVSSSIGRAAWRRWRVRISCLA